MFGSGSNQQAGPSRSGSSKRPRGDDSDEDARQNERTSDWIRDDSAVDADEEPALRARKRRRGGKRTKEIREYWRARYGDPEEQERTPSTQPAAISVPFPRQQYPDTDFVAIDTRYGRPLLGWRKDPDHDPDTGESIERNVMVSALEVMVSNLVLSAFVAKNVGEEARDSLRKELYRRFRPCGIIVDVTIEEGTKTAFDKVLACIAFEDTEATRRALAKSGEVYEAGGRTSTMLTVAPRGKVEQARARYQRESWYQLAKDRQLSSIQTDTALPVAVAPPTYRALDDLEDAQWPTSYWYPKPNGSIGKAGARSEGNTAKTRRQQAVRLLRPDPLRSDNGTGFVGNFFFADGSLDQSPRQLANRKREAEATATSNLTLVRLPERLHASSRLALGHLKDRNAPWGRDAAAAPSLLQTVAAYIPGHAFGACGFDGSSVQWTDQAANNPTIAMGRQAQRQAAAYRKHHEGETRQPCLLVDYVHDAEKESELPPGRFSLYGAPDFQWDEPLPADDDDAHQDVAMSVQVFEPSTTGISSARDPVAESLVAPMRDSTLSDSDDRD